MLLSDDPAAGLVAAALVALAEASLAPDELPPEAAGMLRGGTGRETPAHCAEQEGGELGHGHGEVLAGPELPRASKNKAEDIALRA